jgi:riboflavin synthase
MLTTVRQGHVDGTATIVSKTPDGNSIRYLFALPPGPNSSPNPLLPYLIEKGYVTIDGASLTLTEVSGPSSSASGQPNGGTFGIMLIAHSQSKLTLTGKQPGDTVNVEVDCVGKYVLGALGADGNSVGGIQGIIEKEVERRLGEVEERLWKRLQAARE